MIFLKWIMLKTLEKFQKIIKYDKNIEKNNLAQVVLNPFLAYPQPNFRVPGSITKLFPTSYCSISLTKLIAMIFFSSKKKNLKKFLSKRFHHHTSFQFPPPKNYLAHIFYAILSLSLPLFNETQKTDRVPEKTQQSGFRVLDPSLKTQQPQTQLSRHIHYSLSFL